MCDRQWLAPKAPSIPALRHQLFRREFIERSIRGSMLNPNPAPTETMNLYVL
jgi:hypothetical protein